MNFKKELFTCLLVLLSLSTSMAQTPTAGDLNADGGNRNKENLRQVFQGGQSGMVGTFDGRYAGVKGTPFLLEDWTTGYVMLKDSTVYNGLEIKYDVMGENVAVLLDNNQKPTLITKGLVKSFTLDYLGTTRTFIALGAKEIKNEPLPTGFYELIGDGKTKWLLKHKKEILSADFKGAYSANQPSDRIVDSKPINYILTEDGNIYEVKRKAKSIEEALGKDKGIADYIKKNNIDLKQIDGIKLLMSYLNQE